METVLDKASYIIGRQIGSQLLQQSLNLNLNHFNSGVKDSLEQAALGFSEDEVQKIMTEFQQKQESVMAEKNKEAAAQNIAEGEAFLNKNKLLPDVTTTASGLQYKVINQGTGATPSATDTVETHYEGKLIDGTVFDSSYKRGQPATFPVNGVIKGWQEALQLMTAGTKMELYIPADIAYGSAGSPPAIGPEAVLIFTIELLAIK